MSFGRGDIVRCINTTENNWQMLVVGKLYVVTSDPWEMDGELYAGFRAENRMRDVCAKLEHFEVE